VHCDLPYLFAKGKYKGRPVEEIATTKPDYLEWMLRESFYDDTKAVDTEALAGPRGIPWPVDGEVWSKTS
jgi:hypothetical protein